MLCSQTSVFQPIRVWGVVSAASEVNAGECGMGAKEPPHLEGHTQRDEEVTVDVFEVSGSIKWFDASKGYGFIVPDEDLPDVLLHVTCLRRDGFQTAYEGARVVCEVLRRPKGLQAFRIRAMDDSTAVHPSQLPQRTHVVVIPESDWERATVKWFNRLRGFGFVTRGGADPGHLRAYGDAAALRLHRAQARPIAAGALWPRTEGADGGGAQAGRLARTVLPLTLRMLRPAGAARRRCLCLRSASSRKRAASPPAAARSCSRPRAATTASTSRWRPPIRSARSA